MAVSVRNVEKFVKDHPRDFPKPRATIKQAREIGGGSRGRISAANVELLLGAMRTEFFKEFDRDPEHAKILAEDLYGKS